MGWRSTFKLSKREQFLCSFPLWFGNKLMCITSQAVCRCPVVMISHRYLAKNLQSKQAWKKPGHHTALYRCLISYLISAGKSDVKSIFSPVSLQPLLVTESVKNARELNQKLRDIIKNRGMERVCRAGFTLCRC